MGLNCMYIVCMHSTVSTHIKADCSIYSVRYISAIRKMWMFYLKPE